MCMALTNYIGKAEEGGGKKLKMHCTNRGKLANVASSPKHKEHDEYNSSI